VFPWRSEDIPFDREGRPGLRVSDRADLAVQLGRFTGTGTVSRHGQCLRWEVRSRPQIGLIARTVWPLPSAGRRLVDFLLPLAWPSSWNGRPYCASPGCPYLRERGPFCAFHSPVAVLARLRTYLGVYAGDDRCACGVTLDRAPGPVTTDPCRPVLCAPCRRRMERFGVRVRQLLYGHRLPGDYPAVVWQIAGRGKPRWLQIPTAPPRYQQGWRGLGPVVLR
jgi:hypothetical protein